MDHGDQFETEGRGMSVVCGGEVDLCDNLQNPEALTAQTRNLNETNTQSVPPSNEEVGRCGFQKHSLNNNGKEKEVDQGKERQARRSHEEEEEEDIDAVMREEEEEEESEESSYLIRCQSPGTPMTDSSYSETGSLLETPYPFSPGTSPEPTSPVIPVISPETVYPIGSVETSQSNAEMDSHISSTGSGASTTGSFICTQGRTITTGPTDSTLQTITSDMGPTSPSGPTCTTGATDGIAKNTVSSAEQLTSSTEPTFVSGPTYVGGSASSYPGPTTSTESTRVNTSVASNPMSATTEPLTSTTGSTGTTGTEPNSTTGLISSYTPVTTCFSVPTCTTGPILNTTLQECLGQLAQRGDDTHLPQYLHQVAEAFVLHEDYQRALWCIQLERLYHQRVLENLNALQQQWEVECSGTSSELTTQHLDTLKHICQTHSRPRTRDAECASLDFLRANIEESGALATCTSVHQAEGGMENRAEDSVCPSINLADGLNSPEILEKDREHPDGFNGSQLSDKQGNDRGGEEAEGGVEYAISVIGNGLHPSTAGGMDQSTPAEQQGKDLGPAQEKEVKTEEGETPEEMEDEGDEEEEEEEEGKQEERDSPFCQEALPVETLVSGAELEVQQLQRDALAQQKLYDESQHCLKIQEAHPPQETHMKHREEGEEEEEEEEEDYEVNQATIIREAPSLDDMAKLITIEEMSPASGLVSILKKRSICVDNVTSSEPQPQKATAKRRVRFKVPDDGYEQDVGGGDSCLLLFLLCLVTVVISVGGTALYCALGDAQSSVCQDFSRNADFYISQIQRGVTQIQHWLTAWS